MRTAETTTHYKRHQGLQESLQICKCQIVQKLLFSLYCNSSGRPVMLSCLRRDQIKLLWLHGWVLKTEEHSVVWLLSFCTGMSKPLIASECLSSTPPSFHSHIPHWSYITEKLPPPPPPMLSSTRACIRVTYYAKDLRDIQKITGLVSLKCFLYMTNTLTVEGQGCNFEKQKKKKEI